MPTRAVYGWVLMIVTLIGARAGADVALPLQGYCRAGCYMPVRVDGSARNVLSAGSLPTEVLDEPDSVVPVLVGPTPNELVVTRAGRSTRVSLHGIDDRERLVGVPGDDDTKFAAALFPSYHVLTVPLDAANPLPGPPAAWQALDGIMFDSAGVGNLSDASRSALLAGGATLAVVSGRRPDDGWPWTRVGPLWLLQSRPIGPGDAIVNADVFGPSAAVGPGLQSRDRRILAVIAAVLAGALIPARQLRRPTIAAVGICILTVAGAGLWRLSIAVVVRGEGRVVSRSSDGLERTDTWLYEVGRADQTVRVPWAGFARLYAPSETALADADAKLIADPRPASLQFEYRALPGRCVAFERSGIQAATAIDDSTTRSPMAMLARDTYLRPGVTVVGSRPNPGGWPDVVLEDRR